MLSLAGIIGGALLSITISGALGHRLFRSLQLPPVLNLGLGAALLSHIVFLLLLAGVAGKASFALLAIVILAAACWRGRPRPPRLPLPILPPVWWLLAPFAVLYLVHALSPEIQPDGYTYHLGLVRRWLRAGSFSSLVGFYEMVPHGLEMLFAYAYAFGGGASAKLVHFSFLILTVPLMGHVARHLSLPPWSGWCAALLYLSSPLAGTAGTCTYNDAALAFFTLAVFLMLLRETPGGRRSWLATGLLAGFCYSIKMPGAVVVAAALGWRLAQWRLKAAVWTGLGAAAMMLPWMLRNLWWSGNPFAPLLNGWFPNPYFHLATEREISAYMRSYEGVSWLDIPWELAVSGFRLHGLVGPLVFLLPLALPALRNRTGRLLLGAAAVAAIPWTMNIGARFLLPSLPFFCLALTVALPRRAVYMAALAVSVSCWPALADLYTHPRAWRLRGFPWKAALGLESESQYLQRTLVEYRVASLIERHAQPGERVLDLTGAVANAYLDTEVLNYWQHASAGRAAAALSLAAAESRGLLSRRESRWPVEVLAALRFRMTGAAPAPWSIHEIEFHSAGEWRRGRIGWRIQAEPNVWEGPLALDGNPVTCWTSWQPRRPGMFLQVIFDKPLPCSGVRLTGPHTGRADDVEVLGRAPGGKWRSLALRLSPRPMADRNLRPAAGRALRREGFQLVLARPGLSGLESVGRSLIDNSWDWGLRKLEWEESFCLLRLR